MKFAIDILHPAHVHVFRNFINEVHRRGHEVMVTAREKDCTIDLLKAYNIPHTVLSKQQKGLGLARELIARTWKFYRLAKRFEPDYLMGIMGPTIALAGKLLKAKTHVYYDTEFAKRTNSFVYPLANQVCTPRSYEGEIGKHQVRYPSYHELAYLHPQRFTPDQSVLQSLNLASGEELFIVRFVSWEASHDVGEVGFSLEGKRSMIKQLAQRGRVLITSESELPDDLKPYQFALPVEKIHHVLAHATLLVGESATMASEAACLGTHALYVAKSSRGYINDQQARYGLVHIFKDNEESKALLRLEELLQNQALKSDAQARREQLLAEHVDLTEWMLAHYGMS